jgi:hypothetical protein
MSPDVEFLALRLGSIRDGTRMILRQMSRRRAERGTGASEEISFYEPHTTLRRPASLGIADCNESNQDSDIGSLAVRAQMDAAIVVVEVSPLPDQVLETLSGRCENRWQ